MAESGRLDELKRKFDDNPRRYFAPLANEYRKAGDPDRAIELCRTYLPQQPSHMSGYIVYGQALFDANRSDEAAGVFKQALTLDPENVIAFRYLGDIARSKRDSAGAMRWYGKILELDPRNEEISAQITALATPSSRPIPRNERVAPPTIRPEPKYDASAVALSELVSEPDKHQTERARGVVEPAHGAQAEPAPVPDDLSKYAPEPAPEPAPESEPEAASEPEPFILLEQSFEVISWPHETDNQVEDSAAPSGGPELDQSSDVADGFTSNFAGDFGGENALGPELEQEPRSFADFLPDEPSPSAPIDTDLLGFEDAEAAGDGCPESEDVADTESPDSETDSQHGDSPFVTETMAELYVQQGLANDALVIYRQLVLRRSDPRLHERIAELEGRSAVIESDEPAGESAAAGETVREFFARLGAARAQAHVHLAAENEGGLAAIFGASTVDDADLSAAQSLAGAFGSARPGSSESANGPASESGG